MPRNPYDAVPYSTWPRLETHPDRLAAVAILMGMKPAPLEACRVLEIGCGDGGNLIPMAAELPGARFTGIDLAGAPVARARRAVRAVGLRNIEVRRADLCELGHGRAQFDYIIAHGLYSWIPPAARDALLSVCRRRLAPHGVAFLSYNTYPGRHWRQMLREMTLHHAGAAVSPAGARRFLAFLRDHSMLSAPWRSLLDAEIEAMLERDDAGLCHDDLAPFSQPVYFHEFAAHAARHGLQYLGDVHVHEMVDHRGVLSGLGGGRLAHEQYLDFLKLRRFRQSLACRGEVRLARELRAKGVARLAFSSPARRDGEFLEGAHRVRIRAGDPAVEAIAERLARAWPRAVPASALGDPEILFTLCAGGFVEPHAWAGPAPAVVTGRPEVAAVARYQARTAPLVTNRCHRTVELEASLAALLPAIDGTRTHTQLARDIGMSVRRLEATLQRLSRLELLAAR